MNIDTDLISRKEHNEIVKRLQDLAMQRISELEAERERTVCNRVTHLIKGVVNMFVLIISGHRRF